MGLAERTAKARQSPLLRLLSCFLPAEALPALRDPIQVKLVFDMYYHSPPYDSFTSFPVMRSIVMTRTLTLSPAFLISSSMDSSVG